MMKNNKGITLVALVITIIILIILATITLGVVLGDNGLIKRAKEGAESYKTAAEEESEYLNEIKGLDLASNKAPTSISGKAFDYEIATSGSGTEADPYIITNKEQLIFLAGLVNYGNSFEGKYIKLGNDIQLDSESKWTSIGYNGSYKFEGTFDGNNKTISGLYNNPLFGYIGENGVLKNFTVEGTIQNCDAAIASYSDGTISHCCNKANLSKGSGTYTVAGIVGINDGTVEKCCNYGTISGWDTVAGIAGLNRRTSKRVL